MRVERACEQTFCVHGGDRGIDERVKMRAQAWERRGF
jgi:hypothetical protein